MGDPTKAIVVTLASFVFSHFHITAATYVLWNRIHFPASAKSHWIPSNILFCHTWPLLGDWHPSQVIFHLAGSRMHFLTKGGWLFNSSMKGQLSDLLNFNYNINLIDCRTWNSVMPINLTLTLIWWLSHLLILTVLTFTVLMCAELGLC